MGPRLILRPFGCPPWESYPTVTPPARRTTVAQWVPVEIVARTAAKLAPAMPATMPSPSALPAAPVVPIDGLDVCPDDRLFGTRETTTLP
jgi:hypothetical protein